MNFDSVKNVLLDEAKKAGIDSFDVYYMEAEGSSAETLKDEISSFSLSVNGGVCFRCIVDGHLGCASTELLEVDEMKALVERAVSNARNIESDDEPVIFEVSEKYENISIAEQERPDTARIMKGQIVFLRFILCSGRLRRLICDNIASIDSIPVDAPPDKNDRIPITSK